jgi:hypothetical protein
MPSLRLYGRLFWQKGTNQMDFKPYIPNRENQEVTVAYVKYRFPQAKLIRQKYYRTQCPFKSHEHDAKQPAFDIDKATGLWHCHKCNEGGNLITLAKHFGDKLKDLFIN